jgi:hypothetical protein
VRDEYSRVQSFNLLNWRESRCDVPQITVTMLPSRTAYLMLEALYKHLRGTVPTRAFTDMSIHVRAARPDSATGMEPASPLLDSWMSLQLTCHDSFRVGQSDRSCTAHRNHFEWLI